MYLMQWVNQVGRYGRAMQGLEEFTVPLACSFGLQRNGVAMRWALSYLFPLAENQTDSCFPITDLFSY